MTRTALVEYADSAPLLQELAATLGIDRAIVQNQLLCAGERVAQMLGLPGNPIVVESIGLRACDVAGLLRVGPRLELEISPKFLGASWDGWREDFFFIAMLSRHGRLLTNERIGSAIGTKEDLATLVARAMVSMFWENHRRPLRAYRHSQVADFVIDGEVDAESIVLPSIEGYEQKVVTYDRRNIFNASILRATESLLPEVHDPQTRRQLTRIAAALAPQAPVRRIQHRHVPSRAKRWQSLHELAIDVLRGFGVVYDSAAMRAPGFVVNTWRVWEDLLSISLRLSLGSANVEVQRRADLGIRTYRNENGKTFSKNAWVTPDFIVSEAGGLLIDAKYKGRIGDFRNRISEADLYEALAFATATKRNHVMLLYPGVPREDGIPVTGRATAFETVTVKDVAVVGIEIEVRGISKVGALQRFANGLLVAIREFSSPDTIAVPTPRT